MEILGQGRKKKRSCWARSICVSCEAREGVSLNIQNIVPAAFIFGSIYRASSQVGTENLGVSDLKRFGIFLQTKKI
jgi:hypothetical protein